MLKSMETVAQFYEGKCIAITGGTSFVGLCVIEKLIRSCSNITTIFVLLNKKSDNCPEERLSDITSSQAFQSLRNNQVNITAKLVPVPYNLTMTELEIDDCLLEKIKNEVNVFFHCASAVKFDENLRKAFQINCIGVRNILLLCKKIINIEAICHLSTAYAFCDRSLIGERIYPTGWDYNKVNETLEWLKDEMVTDITPSILNKRPNSYTLTKAFSEEIILNEGANLPVCIVRPGNVGVTVKEPLPGWCPNTSDASSLLYAFGNGLIKPMWCANELVKFEITPVDYVVNAMIASAWKTGLMPESSIRIYNLLVSSETGNLDFNLADSQNRKSCRSIKTHAEMFINYPVDSVNLISNLDVLTLKSSTCISSYFMQFTPNLCLDVLIRICGLQHYKGSMELQTDIVSSMKMLKYLSENHWIWNVNNTAELRNEMNNKDQKMFNFDPKHIDWNDYVKLYANGTKKFKYSDHPCRKIQFRNRLKLLKFLLNGAALVFLWKFLYKSKRLANMYRTLLKYLSNTFLPLITFLRVYIKF